MAETIGFEQLMTLKTRSRASRMMRSRVASSPINDSIMSKFPPDENPLPAPCSRATLVSGSRSTASQTSASWRCMAAFTELSPGESSVMRRTASDGRSNRSSVKSA